MPNDDQSLDIKIRTTADLSGAEALEAQLDRDVAKARELESLELPRRPATQPPTETTVQSVESAAVTPVPAPPIAQGQATVERAPEFPSQPTSFAVPDFNLPSADNLPAAAEKVRAAFERNQQVTAAFFERTLELVEEQTRQLGALDRRLTEVAAQIKGLKNR